MDRPKNYFSLRRDTSSGVIEKDDTQCTFQEWWNGEGIDVRFEDNTTLSLHHQHLHCIVAVAALLGLVDRDEVRETVRKLRTSWITQHANTITYSE